MTNTKETKLKLKPSLFSKIRTYFLTGIVVAAPITVTGWVAIWFIQSDLYHYNKGTVKNDI